MDTLSSHQAEISVSCRFAQEHNWIIQGITGFFSAYYMEKPGFRVVRHYEELETGMHVWLCEIPPDMRLQSLLRRLQFDLPPFRVVERAPKGTGATIRHIIDCRENDS